MSCWNLRLSESRVKLAWAMPSVSKLNKVNFVSASHREPFLVLLRGQILKRVQDDVGKCWLLPIKRLEDGELNSRGFSNPWKASRFNYRTVWKDGGFQYRGTFKSSAALPFRVFTDAIFILSFISTGSRTRGYSPSASRLVRRLVFVCHIWRLGGFDLCIVFNV